MSMYESEISQPQEPAAPPGPPPVEPAAPPPADAVPDYVSGKVDYVPRFGGSIRVLILLLPLLPQRRVRPTTEPWPAQAGGTAWLT